MKNFVIVIFLSVLFSFPVFAAEAPMEALRKPIDQVIGILNDPQYKKEFGKEEQREKIWKIITKVFDFEKIGVSALGRYKKRECKSCIFNCYCSHLGIINLLL